MITAAKDAFREHSNVPFEVNTPTKNDAIRYVSTYVDNVGFGWSRTPPPPDRSPRFGLNPVLEVCFPTRQTLGPPGESKSARGWGCMKPPPLSCLSRRRHPVPSHSWPVSGTTTPHRTISFCCEALRFKSGLDHEYEAQAIAHSCVRPTYIRPGLSPTYTCGYCIMLQATLKCRLFYSC